MARDSLTGMTIQGSPIPAVVVHGATAGTARPSTAAVPVVLWVGSVSPTNAVDGDIWLNTT